MLGPMSSGFEVHPRLAKGGFPLGRLHGCQLLLKNNALFPWLILVPEVEDGIEDLHQLDTRRYAEITAAIREVSLFAADFFKPTKLNVACIGNQVRQMHLHIVARNQDDPAWPGVVWAFEGKETYPDERVAEIRAAARAALPLD